VIGPVEIGNVVGEAVSAGMVISHPQTNGQVERANGMILQGFKPRIFDQLNKPGRK
jgi:hypothetical protein